MRYYLQKLITDADHAGLSIKRIKQFITDVKSQNLIISPRSLVTLVGDVTFGRTEMLMIQAKVKY